MLFHRGPSHPKFYSITFILIYSDISKTCTSIRRNPFNTLSLTTADKMSFAYIVRSYKSTKFYRNRVLAMKDDIQLKYTLDLKK